MSLPSDYHRRQNEAKRKAAMESLIESRKKDWKDAGLLDDIARERVVEHDQTIWKGKPWWVERMWVRWAANLLIFLATAQIVRATLAGAAFDLAVWIPALLFSCQLRLHIARFGG